MNGVIKAAGIAASFMVLGGCVETSGYVYSDRYSGVVYDEPAYPLYREPVPVYREPVVVIDRGRYYGRGPYYGRRPYYGRGPYYSRGPYYAGRYHNRYRDGRYRPYYRRY